MVCTAIVEHDTWAQSEAEFHRLTTGLGAIYTKKGYLWNQLKPHAKVDPPFNHAETVNGEYPVLAQRWACMHRGTEKQRADRMLARPKVATATGRACAHKADACASVILQYCAGSKVLWCLPPNMKTKDNAIHSATPCTITDLVAHVTTHHKSDGATINSTSHLLMPDTDFISQMPHARSIPQEAKDTMQKLRQSGSPVREIFRTMTVTYPCGTCNTPVAH